MTSRLRNTLKVLSRCLCFCLSAPPLSLFLALPCLSPSVYLSLYLCPSVSFYPPFRSAPLALFALSLSPRHCPSPFLPVPLLLCPVCLPPFVCPSPSLSVSLLLSVPLPFCLSPSFCLSLSLSVCLPPFACPSPFLSVSLLVRLPLPFLSVPSFCLSLSLSVCLPPCTSVPPLSVCLPPCTYIPPLSVSLPSCLSLSPSLYYGSLPCSLSVPLSSSALSLSPLFCLSLSFSLYMFLFLALPWLSPSFPVYPPLSLFLSVPLSTLSLPRFSLCLPSL